MDLIKEKLKLLTTDPGCYLMKNENGNIIYVGKAKNLKRRVSSYFNREHTGKTKALVSNIRDFEYIVTESEVESLLLEINLIKKYTPKYNILLKDNKSYPYIEITNEKYPRLIISRPRNIKNHKGKLFGPYPNVIAARKTCEMLNRIYPFRKCHTLGKKLCLYYHIGQCLGYCEKKVDENIVKQMVSEVTSFLKGNYKDVKEKIKKLMKESSDNLNFESAIEYKEMLEYIDKVLENKGNKRLVFSLRCGDAVGNPCVFHSSLIPQLLSLEGDKGGRSVAKKYDCVYVDIADERELMDIDNLSNSKHTVTL